MKLMWLGYLVYSLGNCAIKLCIETDLTASARSAPASQWAWAHWPRWPVQSWRTSSGQEAAGLEVGHQTCAIRSRES